MLCFPQMAIEAQITVEQYLHMTFEHDAEFVHGGIVERALPDLLHSRTQTQVCFHLANLRSQFRLLPCTGIRMKLAEGLYRVADVAVISNRPVEDYPEQPPLVIVEIISPDDRHHYVMEKLEEYRLWGVEHIWVIDPRAKRFWIYTERWLRSVSSLTLADYAFELTPSVLFSDL